MKKLVITARYGQFRRFKEALLRAGRDTDNLVYIAEVSDLNGYSPENAEFVKVGANYRDHHDFTDIWNTLNMRGFETRLPSEIAEARGFTSGGVVSGGDFNTLRGQQFSTMTIDEPVDVDLSHWYNQTVSLEERERRRNEDLARESRAYSFQPYPMRDLTVETF